MKESLAQHIKELTHRKKPQEEVLMLEACSVAQFLWEL